MLTLRVIFYGLVTFVPGAFDDGTMAAVLVNPGEFGGMPHQTRIWTCGKDCKTLNPVENPSTGTYTFRNQYLSIRELQDVQPSTSTRLQRPFNDSNTFFPMGNVQFRDLAWVPQLESVEPYAGTFESSYFWSPPKDGLNAVFKVAGGDLSPCHLVHKLSDSAAGGTYSPRLFQFRLPDDDVSTAPTRAIADAVLLEMELNVGAVHLDVQDFGKRIPQHTSLTPPAKETTLTLIIANFEEPRADAGLCSRVDPPGRVAVTERELSQDLHFNSFYNLSHYAMPADARRVPHEIKESAPRVHLSMCEKEMTRLRGRIVDLVKKTELCGPNGDACPEGGLAGFVCPRVTPHSTQICSPSQFSYTIDPAADSIFSSAVFSAGAGQTSGRSSLTNDEAPVTSTLPTPRPRPVTGNSRTGDQNR